MSDSWTVNLAREVEKVCTSPADSTQAPPLYYFPLNVYYTWGDEEPECEYIEQQTNTANDG